MVAWRRQAMFTHARGSASAACSLSLAILCLSASPLEARQRERESSQQGHEIYRAACAACHGADGRGAPQELVGFDTPLPDFTDCSFSTREPDADWFAIAHDGGPVRAFDRRMPAFGEALAADEIGRAISHVRTFCGSRDWPRGELNLPRALVTEKAYPEDEAVLTAVVDTQSSQAVTSQFLYERRFGAKNQFELMVPLSMQQSSTGSWHHGVGDVAAAVKRVLFHSLERGAIVSASTEVAFPTGSEASGLGKGVAMVEPFVSYGQLLSDSAFVQVQVGGELSTDRTKAAHEVFWRAAMGRTFEQGRFGRAWSPMVELLGSREMESDERALWDITPQVQITLTKRQHIMLNGGLRIPLNERAGRSVQVITYFLWDWFDGSLADGWR